MDKLQKVFDYGQNRIRTAIVDGVPWFVAADVCMALEIGNSSQAIARLDEDEKGLILNDTLGGPQQMVHVNEAGLYSLILTSRKPEARKFKRWITHEVLPVLRRTGTYTVGQEYQIPQTYADALRLAADMADQVGQLKPKAEQFDHFMSGENAQAMNVVAKALGTGRDRLFRFLRQEQILMSNNVPYQRYIERGYFKVIEKTIHIGERALNKPQTLVTPKGVDYIARLLEEKKGA